jgi:hypothetical protein
MQKGKSRPLAKLRLKATRNRPLYLSHSRAVIECLEFNPIVQSFAGILTRRKAFYEMNRGQVGVDVRDTAEMRRSDRY